MSNIYTPEHSQDRPRSAYNVTQKIFTSEGRRQLADWKMPLLKIEFNTRLQSF